MKILLDESLPHALRHLLPTHDVYTIDYLGWKGTQNGALLAKTAESGFNLLLTTDRGMAYEQNPLQLPLAVVILLGKSNDEHDLIPLLPKLLVTLDGLKPNSIVTIE